MRRDRRRPQALPERARLERIARGGALAAQRQRHRFAGARLREDAGEIEDPIYVLSGRMKVFMDDGSESEVGPGDVFAIPPGHDAEVVGDEACEMVDFGEFGDYAKPH